MEFRNDINGLRAIAVMAVVLFHFGVPGFSGGYIGVDVFFVISGFLMTGVIHSRAEQGTFSLIAFYLDRAKRIIPALLVTCLAVLVAGWFLLPPSEYASLGSHVAGAAGFYSNFIFLREGGYFAGHAIDRWLLHTWSLSVEWQFYLLYPVLLIALLRPMSKRNVVYTLVAVSIASFLLCVITTRLWETAAFYMLPTRAWEMLAGGLVYFLRADLSKRHARALELTGITLIGCCIIGFDGSLSWPGGLAIVPVLGTAMVIAAAQSDSIFTGSPVSQFLGKTSYSTYLWHWPLVVILNYFELEKSIGWIVAAVMGSILLGYLSWRFVEQRTPKLYTRGDGKASFFTKPVILLASSAAMLVAGGIVIARNVGIPGRVGPEVLVAEREKQNVSPYTAACHTHGWSTSPGCIIGKEKDKVGAIIIGDSHSESISTAVADAIPSGRGGALFLGYAGCLTVPGLHKKHVRADFQCDQFIDKTFDRLSREQAGVPVFVINRTTYYVWGENATNNNEAPPIYFDEEHRRTDVAYLQDFRRRYVDAICSVAKHHPVYVTMPVPEMPVDPVRKLARSLMHNDTVADISVSRAAYEQRNAFAIETMRIAESTCGVHLLDPTQYLCSDKQCTGTSGGRPLYIDTNHLSESGNRNLIPMFKQVFQ